MDNQNPYTTNNDTGAAAGANRAFRLPPKTWLIESILVTLFCCLPFGIVGIVYAARVESFFYAGLTDAAEEASRNAGKFTKIGFWSGLSVIILYIGLYAVLFAIGALADLSLFND